MSRIERRTLQARSAEYEQCVLKFQKNTKNFLEEAQKQIVSEFGISDKIFEESVNYFDSDSELKEYGEKLVHPIPLEPIKITLSREQTENILKLYTIRMKEFENGCQDLDEYLTLNHQIEDEIFRTYNIEIEELNFALQQYNNELKALIEPLKTQTSYILASTDDSYEL